MLRVVKSESVSGGAVAVRRFVFEFDNGSYLPINTYQLGLTTYIIADDSEGINIEDNSYYIYKNGKWNLSHNEIPTSYNDTTIINNGTHSVSNNDIVGYNDIDVNVESGGGTALGIPKLVSPTALADEFNNTTNAFINYSTHDGAITKNFPSNDLPSYVITIPTVSSIYFGIDDRYRWKSGNSSWSLITPKYDTFNIQYYNMSGGFPQFGEVYDVDTGEALSNQTVVVGKIYKLTATMSVSYDGKTITGVTGKLTEYDEPLAFTVE